MEKTETNQKSPQISDSKATYLNNNSRTAIEKIDYVIKYRQGFTCVFTELGADKSSLLDSLNDKYQSNQYYTTVFIQAVKTKTGFAFLKQLCSSFGLELKYSFYDQCKILKDWLIEQYHKEKDVILFIDDAENLQTTHLDVLRDLIKFEPFYQKLVQVVLIGSLQLKKNLFLSRNKDLLSRTVMPSTISADSINT